MIITNLKDGIFEYSNIIPNNPKDYIVIFDFDSNLKLLGHKNILKLGTFIFSRFNGCYILSSQLKKFKPLKQNLYVNGLGNGEFPYPLLTREYEASYNIDLISKYTEMNNDMDLTISKYVDYTFGIEFETSSGYIPQEDLFKYGLIPLRDGSISGIEYSTIVLKGNQGFNLLYKQLELLNCYTKFNKECALHIHFGGFPVDEDKILNLNNVFYTAFNDNQLLQTLPNATFHTELYKKNKKSYCKLNPMYQTFNDLYKSFVGINYMGSLTQPHPDDITRTAKWNIHSRYVACNLINMLCYNGPKTIEFRFLRPTQNIDIILFWIYTLNAILKYAESGLTPCGIKEIYKFVYPKEIVTYLIKAIDDLTVIRINQSNNGDICNSMCVLENNFSLNPNLTHKIIY